MHYDIEVIREHLTPAQVMAIRKEEKAKGNKVNITRQLSGMVEIEIITPNKLVDITPSYHRLSG